MGKKQEMITKTAYYSFYLAVFIEVLMVLIDKSYYTNPIEGRLFQLTFALFFIKACLTKYTKREFLFISVIIAVGAVSYFVTDRNELIRFASFVIACKGIDMQVCLKRVFYLTFSGCMVIILLAVTGIYGINALTMDYGRGSVETRYTLGMGHPNALHCMVWALTTLGIYLYGQKMKLYQYIVVFTINIGAFLLTDSKTGLLMSVFVIFYGAAICLIKNEKINRGLSIFGIISTAISIGISVLAAANAHYVYNYDWGYDRSKTAACFKFLDKVLTGRIRNLTGTTRWEGTIQTWSIFSEPANNYYFDLGWVRLFYWYGILPAFIMIVVLFGILFYCYKNRKYMEIVMITTFALYTVIEAHAVSVYLARNYVLFIAGMTWYRMLKSEEPK